MTAKHCLNMQRHMHNAYRCCVYIYAYIVYRICKNIPIHVILYLYDTVYDTRIYYYVRVVSTYTIAVGRLSLNIYINANVKSKV